MSGTNLVAVMFSTLAAEMADPERFRRGRTYVRQHAVDSIDVEPATVHGTVQGSRPSPYHVTIRTRPVRRATAVAAMAEDGTTARPSMLVPRPDDLRITCDCPDWGDPCKHQAAALYVFADMLDADPWQLLAWLGRSREEIVKLLGGSGAGAVTGTEKNPNEEVAPWWPLRLGGAVGELSVHARIGPTLADEPEAVLKRVGKLNSLIGGRPIEDVLLRAYQQLAVDGEVGV